MKHISLVDGVLEVTCRMDFGLRCASRFIPLHSSSHWMIFIFTPSQDASEGNFKVYRFLGIVDYDHIVSEHNK